MKKLLPFIATVTCLAIMTACASPAPAAPVAPVADAPAVDAPAADVAAKVEGDKVAKIKAAGKIVLGTSADFPPYEFHDVTGGKDEIAGFDISLAKEIAADLGVKLEIVDQSFNGLIAAMQAGTCDMVISGMNATAERKEAVDFSDEYYYAEQVVVVRADQVADFATIESVKDKTIGAQLGSVQEGIANDQLVPVGAKVFCIANVQGLILEIKSKNVDGIVLDRPIADAFIRQNSDLAISDIELVGEESGFAIAIKKGNDDLVAQINSTLKRLKDENKIDTLFQEAVTLADAMAG